MINDFVFSIQCSAGILILVLTKVGKSFTKNIFAKRFNPNYYSGQDFIQKAIVYQL